MNFLAALYIAVVMRRPPWSPEHGGNLAEYAILLGAIAIICVGAISFIGGDVSAKLSSVGSSLK